MRRHLPSPIALRAFEAAARHMSFTRAGEELGVTQAAISHQVKSLENALSVRLFRRLTRKLALTAEGRSLFAVVGEAFDRIADVADELVAGGGSGSLEVSLSPYVSAAWLSPRIGRFWRQHPNIDLRLHHSVEQVNFAQGTADLAVLWGRGDWPGLACDLLLRTSLSPVCSPSLIAGQNPIRRPDDLRHHTLLNREKFEGWSHWFAAAGVTAADFRSWATFDDHNVLMQAAIEGQGVALGGIEMLTAGLATGRLVQPFKLSVDTDFAYYIVYPPEALGRPKVKAFREWLLAEARDFGQNASAA